MRLKIGARLTAIMVALLHFLGPFHAQKFRQHFEEHPLDQGAHSVSGRRPEVDVENGDGDHARKSDQNHGEEEIPSHERD